MQSAYYLIIGGALTACGVVTFREGKRVAVRAGAAAGFTAGGILFFIGLVNVLSGS